MIKRILLLRVLLGLIIVVLTVSSVLAWDTKEYEHKGPDEKEKWLSIYNCLSGGGDGCSRNEHERVSQNALSQAVINHSWIIGERQDFTAIDLNASLFRPEMLQVTPSAPSGSSNTPLEQRVLPSPAHFAGLPDFSYTMYDWINKNEYCPPRPANDQQLNYCHVFGLWHGAGFNSSHFGSQASRSYQQIHSTALALAEDAGKMMAAANTTEDREAHKKAIQEAELLALAYEAYAQHFLADRWAMGHMLERWGAPEYNASAYGDNLGGAVTPGILAGLVHGYESVAKEHIPDALSSPEYLTSLFGTTLYTPQWRFEGEENIFQGVGDYRYEDMKDGMFGKEYLVRGYLDSPLRVKTQQNWMMSCLSAGFGEVISKFGNNPDGGIGIDGVQITSAGSTRQDPRCFKAWATNYAMNVGWGREGQLVTAMRAGDIVRYVPSLTTNANIQDLAATSPGTGPLADLEILNSTLLRITAKMSWSAFWEPEGIDLAQGGFGDYGDAKTANKYPVAKYFEPTNLDNLPKTDARGRDKESIYGLFNRAKAGYFCEQDKEYLQKYRRSADDTKRAACRLLAQRMYSSTWEEYEGKQAEFQSVTYKSSRGSVVPKQAKALCEIAPGGWKPPSDKTDENPYRLHPGYVGWDTGSQQTNAFLPDEWKLSTQSIAAWCDAVPVIDPLSDEPYLNQDIAARITNPKKSITISGMNFGKEKGELWIGLSRANSVQVTEIEKWADEKIKFNLEDLLDKISYNAASEAFLFITRPETEDNPDPGARSVGRFVLLNDIPRPQVVSVKVSRGDEVFLAHQAPGSSAKDPGAFAEDLPQPEEPGPFRPITPGTVQFVIEFDKTMDQESDKNEFKLGNDQLTGEWVSDKQWRGNLEFLAGDFFKRRLGFHNLSIQAKSKEGALIDKHPEQPGNQADTSIKLLIGQTPLFVSKIKVRAGRRVIYDASWVGGPDLEKTPNLTATALKDPSRNLSVAKRAKPPAEGEGALRLKLSGPVENAPTVTIGGKPVAMEGEGMNWRGSFDMGEAHQRENDGRIPIVITATDEAGQGLDGDPHTVTQINSPEKSWNWVRYETKRGGQEGRAGGEDNWHFLSAPVDLSLAIILDASGSMDDNGRMENAKKGIAQTLDNLPEDLLIEVGGVVFYSCTGISEYSFTRDIPAVKAFLMGASPSSATALAKAHYTAGKLFDASADPAAKEWRFSTFTDGEETCGGNAAGAANYLGAKTKEHRGALKGNPPEEPKPVKPLEQVECLPSSWRGYATATKSAKPFDDIQLIEAWYLERALPDGRCFARLETRKYGVYFGASSTVSGWGINSKPSHTDADFGASSKGVADLDRVRNKAQTFKRKSVKLSAARNEISRLVQEQLGGTSE